MDTNDRLMPQWPLDQPETMLTDEYSDNIREECLLASTTPLRNSERSPGLEIHKELTTSTNSTPNMISIVKPQTVSNRKICCACKKKIARCFWTGVCHRYNLATIASYVSRSAIRRTFPKLTTVEGFVCPSCRQKLMTNALPHEVTKKQTAKKELPGPVTSSSTGKDQKSMPSPCKDPPSSQGMLTPNKTITTKQAFDHPGASLMDFKEEFLESTTPLQQIQTSQDLPMHQELSSSNTTTMLSVQKPQRSSDRRKYCCACNKIFKGFNQNGKPSYKRYSIATIASRVAKSSIRRTFPNLTTDEGYVCPACRSTIYYRAMPNEIIKTVTKKEQPQPTAISTDAAEKRANKAQCQELKMTPRLLIEKAPAQQATVSKQNSDLKPGKLIASRMKSTPVSGPCAEFSHDLEIQLPFELIDLMKESTNPCHFYGKNGDERLMIVGNKVQDGKNFKLLISGPRDFKERTDTVSCCVTDLICLSPRQEECQENMDETMPKCETKLDSQISTNQQGPSITKKLKLSSEDSNARKKDTFQSHSNEKETDEVEENIQFEVVTAEEQHIGAELLQKNPNELTELASTFVFGHDRDALVVEPPCPQEESFNAEQSLSTISEFVLNEELGLLGETELSTSTSAAYDELSSMPNITWSEMNSAGEVTVEVCNSNELEADSNVSAVTVGLCQNDGSLLILGPEESANTNNSSFVESAPAEKRKDAENNDPDYEDDVDADPDWKTTEQTPKSTKTIYKGCTKKKIVSDSAPGKIFHCKLCSYTARYKTTFLCHLHNSHKMSVTKYREMFNFPVIRKDKPDYMKDLTDESINSVAKPYRFRCKLCSCSLVHMGTFRKHLKKCHQLTFQAYFAQFGVTTMYPTTASGDAPKEETSCLCELCGRGFKALSGLLVHLKKLHKFESEYIINRMQTERTKKTSVRRKCPFCHEKFLKADILIHVHREHRDHKDFGKLAEAFTKSVLKTGSGKNTRNDKKPTTTSAKPVAPETECPLCTYSSTDPEDVYQHKLMIHSNWRKFICLSCRASFNTSLALKQHTESKHPTNTNSQDKKCPVCQKVFSCQERCNHHMLVNQRRAAEGLSCHLCHIWFIKPARLVDHLMIVHGEIRKVSCKLCGFGVHTTEELVGHKCCSMAKKKHKKATKTHEATKTPEAKAEASEIVGETERTDDIGATEEMDVT